jgi:hypothetical protein
MGDRTPRNQEGQPPTTNKNETIERLEEKKKGSGGANQERMEDQEREVNAQR